MSNKQELPLLNLEIDMDAFIRKDSVELLSKLTDQSKPLWGIMSAQHMIEHLCYIIENSLGRREIELLVPLEKLPKYKAFLMGPYGFAQNFKFPLLPVDDVVPLQYLNINQSIKAFIELIDKLFEEINSIDFISTPHPIYGPLNRNETITFHYKHFYHHLSQFGLVPINYK